jgi:hypothetical protein
MDTNKLVQRIELLENKVTQTADTLQKIKTYIKWFLVVSVILFVLPLFGLLIVIPPYLQTLDAITQF